jgi:hypothetical protein
MTVTNTIPHPGHTHNTHRRVLDEIGGGNAAPAMSPKTRDTMEIAGLIERLPDRLVGGNVYPINVRQYRMPAAVVQRNRHTVSGVDQKYNNKGQYHARPK